MIQSGRTSPYIIGFLLGEVLLISLAATLAVYIRVADPAELFTWKYSWHRILLVPLVIEATFYYFDLHNFRQQHSFFWTATRVTQALAVAMVGLTALYYAVPRLFLGRGVMILSFLLILGVLLIWRLGYGWALTQKLFTNRLLIIGSGSLLNAILEELTSRSDNLYRVACIIDTDDSPNQVDQESKVKFEILEAWSRILRASLRDSSDDVAGLVKYYRIDTIVVAMDEKRGRMPLNDLLRCRMLGVPILSGEDFYEDVAGQILSQQIKPSWLVFSPAGFKTSQLHALAKRTFDITVSAAGLILSSPLALGAMIAIRMDSDGPVIYSQERVGQSGTIFTIYKFRTMVETAESTSGPVWSQQDDPRITKVGAFLRKSRLDEIPQMWNVLKGDMSFVGPRPERPHFVERLKENLPYYDERHNVKPGITGWAQVCYPYGSSEMASLQKLNYDLYYIKHAGLGMDIMILLQTLKILLLKEGGR